MHVTTEKTPLDDFLDQHRVERLTDYLDPFDEHPSQALTRRLKWATEHADDPVYGDEATFLLERVDELKQRIIEEAAEAELDQVEDADSVDNLDDSPSTVEVTRDDSPYREQYDLHFGGIMPMEDLSEPPTHSQSKPPLNLSTTGPTSDRIQSLPEPTGAAPSDPFDSLPLTAPRTLPDTAAVSQASMSESDQLTEPQTSSAPEAEGTTPVTAQTRDGVPVPAPAHTREPTPPPPAPREQTETFEEPRTPDFHDLRAGIRKRQAATEFDSSTFTRLRRQNLGGDTSRSPVYALGIGMGISLFMLLLFFILW